VQLRVAPFGVVIAKVTLLESAVTMLPAASSTLTVGWAANAEPAVAVVLG
jgi:hypothetical protein